MLLQMIHPSRTLGLSYALDSNPANTNSQGEVTWGRGSNARLFYVMDFSDRSRRSATNYEGKVSMWCKYYLRTSNSHSKVSV